MDVRSIMFRSLIIRNTFSACSLCRNRVFRTFSGSAFDHKNLKKYKLAKLLASTILFGSTFLAILYAKKHRKSKILDECKYVPVNPSYQKNFKLYEFKGYVLPLFVLKNLQNLETFVCRENDIFVVSFPKTGTTWLQELIYCIVEGIDKSFQISIEERFPYLEFMYPGLSSIQKQQGQRFIKTHLPYSLLPEDVKQKKPKMLCIMRNPKDVAVSYYHFLRMITISEYKGTFQEFLKEFMNGVTPYGPVWKHYNELWEHKDFNILVLSYEEFHEDIKGNIRKIANFLEKHLTEKEIEDIAEHCTFKEMSRNPNVNYQHWDDLGLRKKNEAKFMRKGEVGDWKNYFDSDMNEEMELWIDKYFKNISYFTYWK